MTDRMRVRRGVALAGALVTATIVATAGGWLFDTGTREVFIPFDDASVVDAAPDAPPDSSIDAPPGSRWALLTVYGPEGATIDGDTVPNGSDGLDWGTLDGSFAIVSPWEQSGIITVSVRASQTSGTWSTEQLATVFNAEDAKFCDVDQDGNPDVVAGGQGAQITVWFGPHPTWSPMIDIQAASNLQQWLQLDCTTTGGVRIWASGRGTANKTVSTVTHGTDTITSTAHGFTTGDVARWGCVVTALGGSCTTPGGLDLNTPYYVIRTDADNIKLATTRANALAGTAIDITSNGSTTNANHVAQRQAMIGYFTPGVDARDDSTWTWTPIAPVMWAMSVEADDYDGDGDFDVALSDRQNGTGLFVIGNKGSRWFKDTGGAWTRHTIRTTNNEGDPKFLEISASNKVCDGVSSGTHINRLYCSTTSDSWATWTTSAILPYPSSLTGAPPGDATHAQYQGVTTLAIDGSPCDLTGDGVAEYVLSHATAVDPWSGVVAIDGATGDAIDIAGPEKYDNMLCGDFTGDGCKDLMLSEQNEGRGIVIAVNDLPGCAGP